MSLVGSESPVCSRFNCIFNCSFSVSGDCIPTLWCYLSGRGERSDDGRQWVLQDSMGMASQHHRDACVAGQDPLIHDGMSAMLLVGRRASGVLPLTCSPVNCPYVSRASLNGARTLRDKASLLLSPHLIVSGVRAPQNADIFIPLHAHLRLSNVILYQSPQAEG